MFVFCECCVLSVRGLCDELITRPEESYRLWCVVVCDLETSWMRRPCPTGGLLCQKKKKYKWHWHDVLLVHLAVSFIRRQISAAKNIVRKYINVEQLFWLAAHVDPFDTFYGSHIFILDWPHDHFRQNLLSNYLYLWFFINHLRQYL
jgi:hypothetical protein